MIRALLIIAATGLGTCAKDTEDSDQPIIGQAVVEQQRADCEDKGGRFERGGLAGGLVCFIVPPDAGDGCTKESDCTTFCLARSRTCAPVSPLFGCNEILDDLGRSVNICVD